MSDTQLLGYIEVSSSRIKNLVGELRAALQDLREASQGHERMTGPLITARMAQVELGSEAENLQGLIRAGRLVSEWAETRIAPAQGLTTDELRSLHRSGDHTLDPEPELTLTIDRNVSVNGTREEVTHG